VTKQEALNSLKSGSPHERLSAARYLARNLELQDLAAIRQARADETDAYVRTTLDMAISRLLSRDDNDKSLSEPASDLEIPENILRTIRSQAVEEVTALLLHEVASKVGLVANSASTEIPDYPSSRTKRYIENLQRIFEGIQQLKIATATAKPQQIDLAELIDRIIAEDLGDVKCTVSTLGIRPMIVTADPTLLRFAISNGLLNAVEASTARKAEKLDPVVITWGKTDVDYWVAIIDQGAGLPAAVESAFEPGKSNKTGHIGYGLAIAKQSMETLDGSVTLSPGTSGGARYELRWGK
jgi:signal transduction histidine kinase